MNQKEYSVEIGGKTITAQFSDMSDQAHGSVILRMGNTGPCNSSHVRREERGNQLVSFNRRL